MIVENKLSCYFTYKIVLYFNYFIYKSVCNLPSTFRTNQYLYNIKIYNVYINNAIKQTRYLSSYNWQ